MQSFGECDEWSFLIAMVMTTLSMRCCVLSDEHRRVFVRGSWARAGTFGEFSFVKNRRKRHTVCDSTEEFVITTQITGFRIDMSLGKGIIASFRSFQQLSVLARKPPFPLPKKTAATLLSNVKEERERACKRKQSSHRTDHDRNDERSSVDDSNT